ncbi:MAG: zinc chelation protein SecC, partial [Halanaerobium sp.]
KEMRVIDFLDDFINRRFNLKENRKLKKKNVLEKAVKIFNNFQQIDNLKLKSDSEKVSDLLTEIRELPPLNSQAALDILSRYLAAELYDKFEEYAEDISEFQENNPDFLRMIYLKNYNQGNIEEASKNIKQAFELEKERKDDHFHNWQVASDYLQFLVDNGNGEELKSFIIDFDGLLEQSENLLANLMMLIENEQTKGYQKKLLNRLLDLINEDDFLLISVEDIYNNILFINLAELDGEETFIKKGTNKTTENIEDLIREIESSEIYTPALNYAKLRLMRYNSEFKAEEEKLLQSVKNSEIKSYFDAVAYYESIIRYGDPSIIITEIPYGNYIDDDYLDFYRLTAALKLGYYEIGTEIFHRQVLKKSQEKKLMSYLVRLLRYFEIEELFDHLESMDVREEIYNYLIQLDKMSNN